MKLALIGSYGHCNYVLDSPAVGRRIRLAADTGQIIDL